PCGGCERCAAPRRRTQPLAGILRPAPAGAIKGGETTWNNRKRDGCYRERLCPRRCDPGIPVPGHPNVAVLRPMKPNPGKEGRKLTTMPGFTAEVSLYKSSEHYQAAASESTGGGAAAVLPHLLHGNPGCAYWDVCCTDNPNPASARYCCRM